MKLLKEHKGLAKALQELWRELLERGIVKALLLPMKVEGGLVAPGLLTDPTRVDESSVSPYMPVNTAGLLQMMTKIVSPSEKVAVVLRPCEARALVELVKLKQIALDKLYVISIDCPGTYALEEFKKLKDPEAFIKSQDDENIRQSCKACLHPTAPWADIRIGFLGLDNKFLIEALTENGEQVIHELGMEATDVSLKERETFLKKLIEKRKAYGQSLLKEQKEHLKGEEKLLSELSACIGCRNCRKVCPICYCKECFFDSPTFEMEADRYMNLAEKKGVARMPADILLFHTTRMAHTSASCVQCGMCDEACPNEVPVFKLFKAVSDEVQDLFEYEPGRDLEEESPTATFKEEELETEGQKL